MNREYDVLKQKERKRKAQEEAEWKRQERRIRAQKKHEEAFGKEVKRALAEVSATFQELFKIPEIRKALKIVYGNSRNSCNASFWSKDIEAYCYSISAMPVDWLYPKGKWKVSIIYWHLPSGGQFYNVFEDSFATLPSCVLGALKKLASRKNMIKCLAREKYEAEH